MTDGWVTEVESCYETTARVNRAQISFDSTYMQTDNCKESTTARKNHIVSLDHQRPAKRSSNNQFIICHKKSRDQRLNIITLYSFYKVEWKLLSGWAL